MDKNSLNEIVNRKMSQQRMEDVVNKITRESAEIFKLQVNQDTAMWDQKEKYATLQGEYERLRCNARELQAQYEALAGQLQAERRYQPELINKIEATREIFDTLDAKTVQCKQQFAALKKVKEAVLSALRNGDQAVTDLKQALQNITKRYEDNMKDLSYKLEVVTKSQGGLNAFYEDRNKRDQEAIKQLTDLKFELTNKANELTWKLENAKTEMEKQEAYISKLTKEIDDFQDVVENKQNEAKKTIMEKDKDLQTALEEIGSLKTALNNQDAFIKKLCEEKNSLQEQIAVIEEACQKADAANEAYKKNLEDMSSMKEALEKNLGTLKAENESLKKERDDQIEEIELGLQELERSAKQLAYQDNQIDKLTADLEKMTTDCQHKTAQITQLEGDNETLTNKLNEVQTAFNDYRNEVQDEKKNLNAVIEEKAAELELQANTIALITADLQNEKGQRANLEVVLENMRAERDNEMKRTENIEKELQAKVSHLEETVREKEATMSLELSRYLQDRNEHEKEKAALQQKITDLDKRIANVMKEAAGVAAARAPPRFVPEPDDECLLTPPARKRPNIQELREDSLLGGGYFDFYSEDSIDRRDMPGARRDMQSPAVHSTPKRQRSDAPVVERRPFAEVSSNIQNFNDVVERPLTERRFFKSRGATAKPKKKRA